MTAYSISTATRAGGRVAHPVVEGTLAPAANQVVEIRCDLDLLAGMSEAEALNAVRWVVDRLRERLPQPPGG